MVQTLGPMGKSQMSKGEPIKLPTTFLVLLTQLVITAKNWLSWLLHGMGKVWQPKFELKNPSVFGKHIQTPWESKNPKTYDHSLMHPFFCLPHVFGAHGHYHSCFLQFPVFFPHGWEVVLLTVSSWDLCQAFLLFFPHYPAGKMFLGCTTSGRRDPQFLGVG